MTIRLRLAVLGAGTVLGTTLAFGGTAWASDEGTTATPTPAPPSPSATGSDPATASASPTASATATAGEAAPAASVAILPPADRTLVAGGAPVEFTAEIGNTGGAALTGAAALPAFRNDAARDAHEALRADELLLQVETPAGWKSLPLAADRDLSLRGGASPVTDIAPGGSARYTFRLSLTARDAAAQQVDVRLAVRSGSAAAPGAAAHTTLRVARPDAPAAGAPSAGNAEPAPADRAGAASGPTPRTEVLGARPLPVSAGNDTAAPPATATLSAPARAGAAEELAATGGGRPPASLLVSGVVLIVLGAVGFTLVLAHRPARHR
ncbi:hypothetical protein [Kitasatospora phosalacinea]|uniref:hypothetical protein n=1 Tax=Kitasatospora phosalacinea TaxID=2065 RepID=UPI0005262B55|nr:hypothetical protein [Kitasatospora phosalacinea]